MKTFTLFSQPYYDTINQCYYNIITVNIEPSGPLSKFVKRTQFAPLSPFKYPSQCSKINNCSLAIISTFLYDSCNYCNNLLTTDNTPELFNWLIDNGYTINTSLTKMMNQSNLRYDTNDAKELIAMVSYTS
jgi:hypothetical protein